MFARLILQVFAVADPKIPLSLNTVLAATKAYVSSKIKKGKKDEIGGRGGKLEMLEFEVGPSYHASTCCTETRLTPVSVR